MRRSVSPAGARHGVARRATQLAAARSGLVPALPAAVYDQGLMHPQEPTWYVMMVPFWRRRPRARVFSASRWCVQPVGWKPTAARQAW